MDTTLLSRRKFCIGAAILGGSAALAGCSPSSQGQNEGSGATEALNTDVVVVGAGIAGMSCARAAAEGGASVILVDKSPTVGLTFSTSRGNVSICQIEENEEYWQFVNDDMDTMDAFLERYKNTTEIGAVDAPYPDYDRVQLIMTESCKTVAWEEELGVEFEQSFTYKEVGTDTVIPDTSEDPDIVGGQFFNEKMQTKLEELGIQMMLGTEATELIVEDDVVVGVRVNDGQSADILAKAVVLATGGFGASNEYCDSLVPAINEIGFVYHGNPMNTGDAMTMAKAVDAAMYEDCWVIPNVISPSQTLCDFDSAFDGLCDSSMWGASLPGGATSTKILVNAAGERFVNEAAAAIQIATSMTDLNAGPYYVLYDSSDSDVIELLDSALDTGDIFKADTIEELVTASGCTSLSQTFDAYQAAAESGEDAYKAAESIVAYEDGPFYLVKFVPSYVATMGGVKTDANCQAIREDESTIDGLYVIGEATHRFMYNRSFVRHCSNQCAMTMGRMTGETLANTIAEA